MMYGSSEQAEWCMVSLNKLNDVWYLWTSWMVYDSSEQAEWCVGSSEQAVSVLGSSEHAVR